MKGETAELSKLMQNKREEKTTLRKEVFTKKERGERRRLRRKENAKVSAQNFDAAVQVQVAPKPGDNLFKAIAETEVVAAVICKPGVNLFREVKKRGRPPKELLQEQEAQVLQKLYRLTATDKKFVLVSLDAILDSILSQREGEKEKKIKVPTKKAIEKAAAKAADKKAAEDAMTKAAAGAADEPEPQIEEPDVKGVAAVVELGAVDHELEIERLIEVGRERQRALKIEEPDVKGVAAGSDCLSLREATVAANEGYRAGDKELDRLKLEIERLIEVGRERQRALKQLDGDVESIFQRLGELESGEAKTAAAGVLERRLTALEEDTKSIYGFESWQAYGRQRVEILWLWYQERVAEQTRGATLELERVEREIERLERYHGPYDSD